MPMVCQAMPSSVLASHSVCRRQPAVLKAYLKLARESNVMQIAIKIIGNVLGFCSAGLFSKQSKLNPKLFILIYWT